MRTAAALLVLAVLAVLAASCRPAPPGDPPEARETPPATPTVRLVEASAEAGLAPGHVHLSGATAERYLPETMGAGVAVFDADGDQRPDVFLVGGLPVADLDDPTAAGNAALFLSRDNGTFEDATARSGLTAPHLGMGAAVGDVDNDGDLDLLVTGVGGERLFSNRGDAVFDDVTADSGLGAPTGPDDVGFTSSAAFFDYDRDGLLDLFVGGYVAWSAATDRACRPDGVHRIYCTPEAYPGVTSRLYRNLGPGEDGAVRFEDVTADAGLERPGKTLGVAVLDLDGDPWPDLLVANDTARNFLYRNLGPGEDGAVRFEEIGLELGVALGQSGAPRGAMGVDVGDLDGDLRPEVVIGNFAQEMSAVYRPREGGVFVDEAARWGVGLETLMPLAFGVQAVDLDLDGGLDLVFVHGHIEPEIERFQPPHRHAQLPIVFLNRLGLHRLGPNRPGQGAAFEALEPAGALAEPLVGRGLASGDLDGDGDLDLVVTQNGGPPRLWRNESDTGHFLRLRLEGTASNRTGYGARVDVELEGEDGRRVLRRTLRSGRSYLSASEPVLTFGLGEGAEVVAVRVRWPSGIVQELGALEVDRVHTLVEPR